MSTPSMQPIKINDWICLGSGRYRFFGSDARHGNFHADARLEVKEGWRATIEATNYTGEACAMRPVIEAYVESM